MSLISNVFKVAAKTARPVAAEVVPAAKNVVNPVLQQKAQETFGSVLLDGVRGDIAIIRTGITSDSPTIFARIGKDGTFETLKRRIVCKPSKLNDGSILRRRLDYSGTKTLDGEVVLKSIINDRWYNQGGLTYKIRRGSYDAQNAFNGNYTWRLPYTSRTEYDITNGTYNKYIEAASEKTHRIAGEQGSLSYENGHITISKIERWAHNQNLQGDDIRRTVGTAGFLNPKFM